MAENSIRRQLLVDTRDYALLVVISLGYCAAVVTSLGWHGLWVDELHTINAIERSWSDMLVERASRGHPPLFFMIEKLWMSAFPRNEFGYRFLPASCGLATVLLSYLLVRQRTGALAAFSASSFLALSSTQLLVCQMARSYAVVQLLLVLQAALCIDRTKLTCSRAWMISALSFGALATHGLAMIAIPASVISIVFILPSRWRHAVAISLGTVGYAGFALSLDGLTVIDRHIEWIPAPTIEAILQFPAKLQFGRQFVFVPYWIRIATSGLFIAATIMALRGRLLAKLFAVQLIITWAGSAVAASAGFGICHIERYFVGATFCQAIIIGLNIDRVRKRSQWIAHAATGLAAVLALCSSYFYFTIPPFTPWREMARVITANRQRNEIVFVGTSEVLSSPLQYYYKGEVNYFGYGSTILVPQSKAGVWICFPRRDEEELNLIPEDLRARFGNMEVRKYAFGLLVHLK